MRVSEFQLSRGLSVALVVLAPLLAGCSSLPSPPSSFSSIFGKSSDAGGAQASAATTATLPDNFACPDVSVRQGAATMTSSANPAEPTATNLRYQVTISTTARECRLVGNNMLSIKVGLQGRVILGPEGNTGTVDVPVRYAVVREGVEPKTITTKLDRVPVAVPPSDTNVLFTHVTEGLEFPMPRGAEIEAYVVYIGFDPGAAAPERKRPAKPQRRKTS